MSIGIIKKATLASADRGKSGLTIIFNTAEKLTLNSYVKITYLEKERLFKVVTVEAEDALRVNAIAREAGYWATKLSEDSDFDLKDILGLGVVLITEPNEISEIQKRERYC